MNYTKKITLLFFIVLVLNIGKLTSTISECSVCKKPKKLYPIIELKDDASDLGERSSILFGDLIHWYKDPRVRAMLHTIAITEGAMNHKLLNSIEFDLTKIPAEQYQIAFTKVYFDSFDKHPGIVHTVGKLSSSASGRYQFLLKTWNEILRIFNLDKISKKYKKLLNQIYKNNKLFLKNPNEVYEKPRDLYKKTFNPFLQDLGAIYLLYKSGSIPFILKGNIQEVLPRIAPIWASIPEDPCNISYYSGQPAFQFDFIINIYKKIYNKLTNKMEQ